LYASSLVPLGLLSHAFPEEEFSALFPLFLIKFNNKPSFSPGMGAGRSRKRGSRGKTRTSAGRIAASRRAAGKSPGKDGVSFEKIVPDTSIIVEGLLSRMLERNRITTKQVIIHEAVLAELESQANRNRETGYLGLDEVKRIRLLSSRKKFRLEHKGSRPGDFEIRFAKSGEIDSLIRDLALREGATLVTADIVQSKVAEAKGIPVFLYRFPREQETPLQIEKYFRKGTVSVSLREGCAPAAKIGVPGAWKQIKTSNSVLSREELQSLSRDVMEKTKMRGDSFLESDRKGSTLVQLGDYKIMITRPPFSDGYEINASRPLRNLRFEECGLSPRISQLLLQDAKGIIVAGSSGSGRSTFAQAVAAKYSSLGKNVRTIESSRGLTLPKDVTRYNPGQASIPEVLDALLLSKPDLVVFDEIKNPDDFKLFFDLRISGLSVLGVLSAAQPIDAVKKLAGKMDLGLIPGIADTIVFIEDGKVSKAGSLILKLKAPSGIGGAPRPVLLISDFESGRPECEMYTFDGQVCVVEVGK
jgi:ATPase